MPIDYSLFKFGKPETRRRQKARKDRRESAVKQDVRAKCVERDGYCRVRGCFDASPCAGPSEWAHLPSHRRSATRGRDAEERHATAGTMMLCRRHHAMLDGKSWPKLVAEGLTDRQADGPMRFTKGQQVYSEVA